jgi:hypothetical protein
MRQSSNMIVAVSDAELVIEADDLHARRPFGHEEGFDGGPTEGRIESRPDNDGFSAFARRHEDLFAGDKPGVSVQASVRPYRGGVGPGVRFGDCHRDPAFAEAGLLFFRTDRAERRIAEPLPRNRQCKADVSPAELHHAEDRCEIPSVAIPRRRTGRVFGGGVSLQLARRGSRSSVVHAVEDRGEHVEFLWVRVLRQIVFARNRTKDGRRNGVSLLYERAQSLRNFEVYHQRVLLEELMPRVPLRARQSPASLGTSVPPDAP